MYSKLSSTSNKTYDVLMQTETSIDDLVAIYFQYTDKYHQDLSYWKNVSIELNLFAAEPPVFDSQLNDLKMSRCSSFEYQLPKILDSNGFSWNLTLDPSTPDWTVYTGNTFIKIDPPLIPNDFEENFEVKLKLENEVRAWNNYSFNVMLEPYFVPQLNVSGKIKFSLLDNSVELNVNSKKEINVVYCDSNTIISWLKFDKTKSILVKNQEIDGVQICCRLQSFDSCDNIFYSENFTIIADQHYLTTGNTLGPIKIYVNDKTLFLLPDDLFIYFDDNKLNYSITPLNCSKNERLDVGINKRNSSFYLYLMTEVAQICYCSIHASASYNQTAEIEFEVISLNCASKDCIKCHGPTQSDCEKCSNNYIMNHQGQCLASISFISPFIDDISFICGVISCCTLVLCLIMGFMFGRRYLILLSFAQTILVFVYSIEVNDLSLISFTSWFQFAKLDLRFLHLSGFDSMIKCEIDSAKMMSLQFRCHSTVYNYFWILLLAAIILLIYQIIKLLKENSIIIKFIRNKIEQKCPACFIIWIILHLFYQLILINIIKIDLLSLSNHTAISIFSIILFSLIAIYLCILKYNLFSLKSVKEIDPDNHFVYTICSVIRYTSSAFLFSSDNSFGRGLFLCICMVCDFTIVLNQISYGQPKIGQIVISKYNRILKHTFFYVVLWMIIYFAAFMRSNSQKLLIISITSYFVFSFIIEITITMLLCKELILIRGQPPRQSGSPRVTLDRGEFT